MLLYGKLVLSFEKKNRRGDAQVFDRTVHLMPTGCDLRMNWSNWFWESKEAYKFECNGSEGGEGPRSCDLQRTCYRATIEETRTEAQFNFCFVQEVGGMIRDYQKRRKGDGKGRHRGAGGRVWGGRGLWRAAGESSSLNLPSIAVINYPSFIGDKPYGNCNKSTIHNAINH